MTTTIKNESALPPLDSGGNLYYIRSKIDPTGMIHAYSGEVFDREDGRPWKDAALWVIGGGTSERPVSVRVGTAYGDRAVYPYDA